MDRKAIELHLSIIGNRKNYCIFGGKQEWDEKAKLHRLPKTSRDKATEWVLKDKLIEVLGGYYNKKWTLWISLNEKETGDDTIEGVKSISVFWFDFDAPRANKAEPATDEERNQAFEEAKKFKEWMQKTFDVIGFIACSGNGYHLFYPVEPYPLLGKSFRKEVNEKQRTLFKKLREKSNINFDTTTDIRRVTQPIGGLNYKIPDNPIKTYWIDNPTDKEIEEACKKNLSLLTAVLNTKTEETHIVIAKDHPKFTELLECDRKLKELYAGNWQKYNFKSRSEAEQSLVTILCMNGFGNDEIKEIMKSCKIGKWQEREEAYYNATIKKGREFATSHPRTENVKSDEKLHDTDYYLIFRVKKDDTKEFGGIKEKLFADDLTGIYHFKTLRDTEEVLYYEGGYYHYEGEAIIGAECERVFGKYIKTRNVAEILNHVRRATYIKRNKLNTNKSVLPLQNGLFDLTTHSLNPFNPDVLITYKLPVEYNPDANCPNIKNFIDEILNPEDIPIIQEYFGYALLPAFPAHKSLWLYGIGRNGKSQIISLLSKMLGDENTVSVPIEEFDGWHRFSTARLFGKLLNVTSEPGVEKPLKSGLFKKVIGGDRISAEIKGKQRTIDFVNFSKFVVLGNIFPQVTDPSLAFWDRLIVVEFPNTFVDNFIPDIAEKLIKEDGGLSGFFNWCLEGLKRLKGNGFTFTTTKNTEEMKLEFEKLSNPVMAFIKEECIIKTDKIITKGKLYNAYKDYCGDGNYKIAGKAEFSKQIGEIRGVDGKKARSGGKVAWCWIGMDLQNENDDESVDNVTVVDTNKNSTVNAPLLLTKDLEKSKRKDRVDICNVNNGNNVNDSGEEEQKITTPPQPQTTPLICVCGKLFDTQEVLQEHQSKCKEFQAMQDKEAREEIRSGETEK